MNNLYDSLEKYQADITTINNNTLIISYLTNWLINIIFIETAGIL